MDGGESPLRGSLRLFRPPWNPVPNPLREVLLEAFWVSSGSGPECPKIARICAVAAATFTSPENRAILVFEARNRQKGSLGKGVFPEKILLPEILENLVILEILENPQTLENEGESNEFLEILKNLEILEIPEIPQTKKTLP